MSTSLSPDRLAALEEERDFLLKSLADLDAERAAGDIDDADHQALTDGYTARAAEVLRAIDEHRDAVEAARPPRSRSRVVIAVAGVAVVAVLAGVLMAQASGRRQPGDTITGNAPKSATAEAQACLEKSAGGDVNGAVTCYQDVLERHPDNPSALTYLAWTLYISTSSDADLPDASKAEAAAVAGQLLARSVAAAPQFADAYAFQAVIAYRDGRYEDADAALDELEARNPPASVTGIVAGLREQVDAKLRAPGSTTSTTSTTAAPG